ncbi:hypothetical protein MPSEU_000428200 [Mayamaea pseudoterrestris]|nr:hypothetical protein MPSEU_000428200 [Mayamaea pseudoterrestris]
MTRRRNKLKLFLMAASPLVAEAFVSQKSAIAFPQRSIEAWNILKQPRSCSISRSSLLQVSLSTPYLAWRNDTSVGANPGLFPNPSSPATTCTPNTQTTKQKLLLRRLQEPRVQDQAKPSAFQVYCDLDGVLVDFEYGIRKIFPNVHHGIQINDIHRPTMWLRVASMGSFFESLPWTSDGQKLWDAIRHLSPDILSGVPTSYHDARAQKVRWCERELGLPVSHLDMAGHMNMHASVNDGTRDDGRFTDGAAADAAKHGRSRRAALKVITCWSHNKHHESGSGRVLIDDCKDLGDAWMAKGGIFIHHRGDADETIAKLYEHGILNEKRRN